MGTVLVAIGSIIDSWRRGIQAIRCLLEKMLFF
jgi:hypothetical protein